jgi:adenylate cyclase
MKRTLLAVLAGIIATLIYLVILLTPFGEQREPLALDLWAWLRGPLSAPQGVAIVAMDEQSYNLLSVPMNQAWPRQLHAELLKRLKELGARRVVMDILFIDPGSDPAADKALAESIAQIPTVLGADVGVREQSSAAGRYAYEELNEPHTPFLEAAETAALVRVPSDGGYVRRFFVDDDNASKFVKEIPTLALAGAGLTRKSPTLPSSRDFIKFYGPPGTVETFPYHQLMNPKNPVPRDAFAGKVVFVGLVLRSELGPGVVDSFHVSSLHRDAMFGVEIHATAAANLLTNDWISRASGALETLILLLVTFIAVFSIFVLKPLWAALLGVGLIGIWSFAGYLSFMNGYFLPGFSLITTILPLALLINFLLYYVLTVRSQQQVERAFQFYLSPEMAKEMSRSTKALELGGEGVHATALFTDIAGFTQTTEGMLPAEVSTMLNAYFTEVMDVIFERKGTLIKFIGDAVFVIWGAPIKVPEHARLATLTALEIQRNVDTFNRSKRFPPLITRIGINTGPMVVGNLGSARRFDYTAIGDTVNLASRLEGLNKYFGSTLIISESTRREVGDLQGVTILPFGLIQAAGKREATAIYGLFESPFSEDIAQAWQKALTHFRRRKWEEAQGCFSTVLSAEPRLEKASQLYLRHIAHYNSQAPEDEWEGHLEFDSK